MSSCISIAFKAEKRCNVFLKSQLKGCIWAVSYHCTQLLSWSLTRGGIMLEHCFQHTEIFSIIHIYKQVNSCKAFWNKSGFKENIMKYYQNMSSIFIEWISTLRLSLSYLKGSQRAANLEKWKKNKCILYVMLPLWTIWCSNNLFLDKL